MSDTNTATETAVDPNVKTVILSFLDVNLLEKDLPIPYTFIPPTDVDQAMADLASPEKILAALVAACEEKAQQDALQNANPGTMINRTVALDMAAPLRNNSRFAIVKNGPDGTINGRPEQTKRIFAYMSKIPAYMDEMIEQSKQKSA